MGGGEEGREGEEVSKVELEGKIEDLKKKRKKERRKEAVGCG